MMNNYLAQINFSRGEKPIRFSVKAPNETIARRKVNQLLNKLGKRSTQIGILEIGK